MKSIAIGDFLTPDEITFAVALWEQLHDGTVRPDMGSFAAIVDREIITPNLARINAALGQENDARYLAYAVEYAFVELGRRGR